MKKRILAALLAVLMIVPMMVGAVSGTNHLKDTFENEDTKLASMTLMATSNNGNIELYCDEVSGELAVKNKTNGQILLSNPYDVASKAMSDDIKGQYLSQVFLNFVTIGAAGESTFYSYKDCVTYKDQLKIEKIDGGISVEYTLGDGREQLLLPMKIEMTKMDKILEQLPEENNIRKLVQNLYTLYYPNQLKEDGSYVIKSQSRRESMIKAYPICATTPIYVIGIDSPNISTWTKASDYIDKYTDYTYEQLNADYEEVREETDGDKFTVEEKPHFTFNVKYTVDNDGFKAELDAGSMKYNKEKYYVSSVSILPYFAAAQRLDKGYTFIPDGSGAIIRFEDIVANSIVNNATGVLYGTDFALYQISDKNVEQYTMPVFGLVNSSVNDSFFAIIEDGDALASISSLHTSYYHSVYSSFKLITTDKYDLADAFSSGTTSSNLIGVRADQYYEGKCTVKYAMLSEEKASYLGMANYYRDYLIANGTLDKIKAESITDFTKLFIEVFGSIQVDDKFLTFPVKKNMPLTTFKDVEVIHKELKEAGLGNMTFLLKGFNNGGLNATYPTSVKWQKVLGGKAGLNELLEYARGVDLEIAPDVEFTYSKGIKSFSGFNYKKNGVRTLDNRYSTKREYNASTQTFERTGGVAISSASFALAYDKFYDSVSQYQLTSLAVRTLGSDLNSDLDKADYYDREASKDNVVNMLQLLNGKKENSTNKGYNLLIASGNSYAIPYASSILGASLDSSRFFIQSEAVPFYGIVYHASKEFAGNPINMDGDSDYMFLKALENGASLYFTTAMQNTEYLKFDKEYNKYYSVKYSILKDEIISLYKEFNELMKDKQDKYIVEHQFMNAEYGYDVVRKADNVALNNSNAVLVVYEGGEGFILNYNSYDIVVNYEGNVYEIAPFSYAKYSK